MQSDYLVVGAGATGMAFLDVILSETDATVAIVDRRDAPGGHWNDAYPFVRLHQESSFYGVPSRNLGLDRRITHGYNEGLMEMASKAEILHYYADLMNNTYLPSGRVQYFPMSEHLGDGVVRSLVSGTETRIEIGRKLVNAGIWGDLGSIPLTHERGFEVAEGVRCIPPNDLPRQAAGFEDFTVIGGGKTAMDAVLWLLARDVAPDRISWVRPNDYWMVCRDTNLTHRDFFFETLGTILAEYESLATAPDIDTHCANLEASGKWHRIDSDVWPRGFHAAVCSKAEVAALRLVKKVIRAGHLHRIDPDRLHLAEGQVAVTGQPLYIDCTARAGVILDAAKRRVFDGDTINLFMVRPFQPLFSAALAAHLEALDLDDATRQRCTGITNFHDTPAEYVAVQLQGFMNQHAWNQIPEVQAWIDGCRLNAGSNLTAGLSPDDQDKMAVLAKIGPMTKAAIQNMPKMLAASG